MPLFYSLPLDTVIFIVNVYSEQWRLVIARIASVWLNLQHDLFSARSFDLTVNSYSLA
jgi:hypothetical protein